MIKINYLALGLDISVGLKTSYFIILWSLSTVVVRMAVNHEVVGSNPTGTVNILFLL